MAGRGPAPKLPDARRNHHSPIRGEWAPIYAEAKPKIPALPGRGRGRGHWSPRTRKAWKSWWAHPAATMWGVADRDLVEHLADLFEDWVRKGTVSLAAEIRHVRDSLGLTPKGKQDRRWYVAPGVNPEAEHDAPERAQRSEARRSRLTGIEREGNIYRMPAFDPELVAKHVRDHQS